MSFSNRLGARRNSGSWARDAADGSGSVDTARGERARRETPVRARYTHPLGTPVTGRCVVVPASGGVRVPCTPRHQCGGRGPPEGDPDRWRHCGGLDLIRVTVPDRGSCLWFAPSARLCATLIILCACRRVHSSAPPPWRSLECTAWGRNTSRHPARRRPTQGRLSAPR